MFDYKSCISCSLTIVSIALLQKSPMCQSLITQACALMTHDELNNPKLDFIINTAASGIDLCILLRDTKENVSWISLGNLKPCLR